MNLWKVGFMRDAHEFRDIRDKSRIRKSAFPSYSTRCTYLPNH